MNYNPFRPKKLNQLPEDIQKHILSFHPMSNTIQVSFEFHEDLILFIGSGYILVTYESNAAFRIYFPDEYNYLKNLILTNSGYSYVKGDRNYVLNLDWFPQIDPQAGFKYVGYNHRNEFAKQAQYFDLFDYYKPYLHMKYLYDQTTYFDYVAFKMLREIIDHYDLGFHDITLNSYLYRLVRTYIRPIEIDEVHDILNHIEENEPDKYKIIMRNVNTKRNDVLTANEYAENVFTHDFWRIAADYIENLDPILLDRYYLDIHTDVSSFINISDQESECLSMFQLTTLNYR